MAIKHISAIALLLLPMSIFAAPTAVVDSLMMPAWVERDGSRIAVSPGMILQTGDQLRTGTNGKLLVKLEEGSDLKLGEDIELAIQALKPAAESPESVFRSSLNVLKGAFRFTTSLFGETLRRDVRIHLGTATAGVRGTDLWGKSSADRSFVVLLEGKIDLTRIDEPVVKMEKPLTIYQAYNGEKARAVEAVDPDKLALWALETELNNGEGVLSRNGNYTVYIGSYQDKALATKAVSEFRYQGYAVELIPTLIADQRWYRLGIKGFNSKADAIFFKSVAQQRFGIADAWLPRQI